MFTHFGSSEVLVSDNRIVFASTELAKFSRNYQIRHITVVPYHPSSNRQIERMVQETKPPQVQS